mmetsp:Transcript_5542/g.11323  ORF Transcript_5542/g.11323 Transcript_5542/m.11323 type:complete len:153 (-) Transcript_5542:345-803(-)
MMRCQPIAILCLWMVGALLMTMKPAQGFSLLRPTNALSRPTSPLFSKSSFLQQMDGESSSEYMKRLSKIASDPALLELSVQEHEQQQQLQQQANNTVTTEEKPKKTGYVRAEEWDAQHKADMSWDQKVAFDGQRYGNRFNQNEILRKNLNQF